MAQDIIRSVALVALGLGLAAAAQAHGPAPGTWRQIVPSAISKGLDGKAHAPACSGYPGTDTTYSFWAKRGRSKNLVVYFEGGGACWNDFSCSFPIAAGLPPAVPQTFVPQIPPGGPQTYSGIFDASHPDNPVKDWSMVYIPYCTGDVHVGARNRVYANAGHPVFPLPPMFQIHHGGFSNFMVVMDWVRRNVDDPDRVFVAGSSAGGYGASANFPWVQKVFPKAKMSVLADASQGVLSQGFDKQDPGRKSWNPQVKADVFGSDVDALATADILAKAAKAFPRARVAQFTTQVDAVQVEFHGLAHTFNPPGASCSNLGISWNNQMLAGLLPRAEQVRNFNYYLAAGSYHTILRSPQMYSESSTGRPFTDWLAALVSKRDGDDDDDDHHHRRHNRPGRLDDQACPGCLTPIPCQ